MSITAYILSFSIADAPALGSFRVLEGITVAETNEELLLRVDASSAGNADWLRGVPALKRRELSEEGLLFEHGHRLAEGRLSLTLHWVPLRDWLQVRVPAAALPGVTPARVRLELVPGNEERSAEFLLVSLSDFERYTSQAPVVRLEQWHFALNAERWVVVRGIPIPPLPGSRFYEENGVAVPLGFRWEPALSPEVVARWFGLRPGDLALWEAPDSITIIASDQWVPASRAAVRASLATQ